MARSNKPAAEVSEQEAVAKTAPAEAPVSTATEPAPKSGAAETSPVSDGKPKNERAVETVIPVTPPVIKTGPDEFIPEQKPVTPPALKKGQRKLADGTIITDNTHAEGAINPNQSPNVFFVQQKPKAVKTLGNGTVREDY
jgi:hypothetical protein